MDYQQHLQTTEQITKDIKPLAEGTYCHNVLNGVGQFASAYEIPEGYSQPVLVSATDGVGTKLKLAQQYNYLDQIGIDLVAMCVNDLITSGADPLYFLDYYATGKFDQEQIKTVISGVSDGCHMAGCALTGGETAELKGMLPEDIFDIAGFATGIVEKSKILGPHRVQRGDSLIGLASNGIHSNGYTLVSPLLQGLNLKYYADLVADVLKPTRIYVKPVQALLRKVDIHAIAHITGGGFTGNMPRVLPQGLNAEIDFDTWERPKVFSWIQWMTKLKELQMLSTFNCGIGMVLALRKKDVKTALHTLDEMEVEAYEIGRVRAMEPVK